jgi:hypothetical protein
MTSDRIVQMGIRSWLADLLRPIRSPTQRNLAPRAERRLAAKERHREHGGLLWTKADRVDEDESGEGEPAANPKRGR